MLFGSRSGTPETQSSRATPPPTESKSKSPLMSFHESKLAGTKRKVESDDNLVGGDGTPPSKKTALSS